MNESDIRILSLATASPEYVYTQAEGAAYLLENYADILTESGRETLKTVFAHPSVRQRHFSFSDPGVIRRETPDERIERFTRWSVDLSARAADAALARAGLSPRDVAALVVNTCTGYLCPGITSYLVERMNLPRNTLTFDLVGSGCGGAIPNLQMTQGILRGLSGGCALSVSVEVCSCTFQMGNDPSLLVSNALFGDGAAAAVLGGSPGGLRLAASAVFHAPEYRDDVRFVYRDGQLHNRITRRLPLLAARAAETVVHDLLESAGIAKESIRWWAVHSGGDSIINAVRDRLGLPGEAFRHTRTILSEYGNLSSATVWYVLQSILDEGIDPGDRILMLAFGAGMSAHAFLLEAEGTVNI